MVSSSEIKVSDVLIIEKVCGADVIVCACVRRFMVVYQKGDVYMCVAS